MDTREEYDVRDLAFRSPEFINDCIAPVTLVLRMQTYFRKSTKQLMASTCFTKSNTMI